ncbi:uncharacterized protein (TIGR02246 family) [Allocatelliglobosispora scoriae]|uniref:Uncharacterized protein (TIGR02246 family) n=1 Tax=Allocatelliglobosispora scoriae TaxID=643052 RepID=A0A841BRJ8_9ACTN|nr:SgcJ/EcaC family oxidoreductase [Allocatelliglobosispora scoriae]MBB5870006.1 uncharacterized protein (TIGR02246 family) [Allocatelliglobosispora scoriae]
MTETSTATTSADQLAVTALTQRVIAAWAEHDAKSFADVFTEDGTMILSGLFKKGRDDIRQHMAEAFAGPYQGTRVTGQPIDIKFFCEDSGVLITQGGVLAPGESEVAAEHAIRASWVVVKQEGQWRLAAYQNSPKGTAA